MRITTVMNQKGGVGKTTTAHALATGLHQRGYRVLVIDADPQSNLTLTYGANPTNKGLYELMKGEGSLKQLATETGIGDLLTSSLDLCSADMEFVRQGREYILREALTDAAQMYDHVIIDSPPSLNILNINALTASTDVIIPLGADIYSLHGLQQLLTTINTVRRYSNPALSVAGLLICRKGIRANVTTELVSTIRENGAANGLHVYSSMIREATAIKEAQLMCKSIFEYAPKAAVTGDYSAFIDEYLKQE